MTSTASSGMQQAGNIHSSATHSLTIVSPPHSSRSSKKNLDVIKPGRRIFRYERSKLDTKSERTRRNRPLRVNDAKVLSFTLT
jgi:hypothetical protein